MRKIILIGLFFLMLKKGYSQQPAAPDKIFGQLFLDVQNSNIFDDSKTFADAIPVRNVSNIMYDYGLAKGPGFNLRKFIGKNFSFLKDSIKTDTLNLPDAYSYATKSLKNLTRQSNTNQQSGSLMALPNPYIMSGGKFGEMQYWDSYFILLGLKEMGDTSMIENIINNCAWQINQYGYIPMGNRTYYRDRSQPPFFSLMIELLAGLKGDSIYKVYLPQLEKEYDFWMGKKTGSVHKCIMPDGTFLNRYFDSVKTIRPENYKEDMAFSHSNKINASDDLPSSILTANSFVKESNASIIFQNLRIGSESGWDFSSRWFGEEKDNAAMQPIDRIPVDLNCLLYHLEKTIAKGNLVNKNLEGNHEFEKYAEARKKAILKYCWNAKMKFFTDYDLATKKQNSILTAAGFFPLFFNIATFDQANTLEATATKNLLKSGGILCTNNHSGLEWDAPNGWPQMQWVAAKGLQHYGQNAAAKTIAGRWINLVDKVYQSTHKIFQKYNVEDAGGNIADPNQIESGFGVSNGVYLALKSSFQN